MPMPKSLLDFKYPEGFDETGRRLLARCKEFALFELYEVGTKDRKGDASINALHQQLM